MVCLVSLLTLTICLPSSLSLSSLPSSPSSCPCVASLRAQLLLTQYISALLGTVGKSCSACPATPANFASPKTQIIFDQLVYGPLKNPRGHGCMVVVR